MTEDIISFFINDGQVIFTVPHNYRKCLREADIITEYMVHILKDESNQSGYVYVTLTSDKESRIFDFIGGDFYDRDC